MSDSSSWSDLGQNLEELHPCCALLRFLNTDYTSGTEDWSVEERKDKLLIRLSGKYGKTVETSVFELDVPQLSLARVTETINDINQQTATWTRIDSENWTYERELKNPAREILQRYSVTVRIRHNKVGALAASVFALPLKPGGKVMLRSLGLELPAEAFLEGKVKLEDIQKIIQSKAEGLGLKETVDESVIGLPSEVEQSVQDAVDGAKKLLKGGDADGKEQRR